MKKIVFALALLISASSFAQTVEELKAEKAKKAAEAAKLQGEVDALQAKIDAFPGWKYNFFGTIGANFSGFNDWYSNAKANSNSGNIGVAVTGIANLDREKYFWRNTLNINLGWVKLDDKTVPGDESFNATTDVFNLNSLYGYKLSKTLAVSAMAEYRTTLIENFNNPGYLDVGAGITWTPIQEFVLVVHPLNYNFVFSNSGSSYDSSMGAKFMADYNKTFGKFKFRSNATGFLSYKSSDLSNWTWTNSLGFNIWKGIGVGLEAGLRGNKQEAYNALKGDKGWTELSEAENKLQSYWLVGLSYGF